MSSLRAAAETALELEARRRASAAHEALWLNTVSYLMRPGLGHSSDGHLVERAWHLLRRGPHHDRDVQALCDWALFWRRTAPGLASGRQIDLFQRFRRQLTDKRNRPRLKAEGLELWRLAASLEHLPAPDKAELGERLLRNLEEERPESPEASLWALARFGTRQPLYGALEAVLPRALAETWLARLLRLAPSKPLLLAGVEIARKTGDRELDISAEPLSALLRALEKHLPTDRENWNPPLTAPCAREFSQQAGFMGDSLPAGLVIAATDEACFKRHAP